MEKGWRRKDGGRTGQPWDRESSGGIRSQGASLRDGCMGGIQSQGASLASRLVSPASCVGCSKKGIQAGFENNLLLHLLLDSTCLRV